MSETQIQTDQTLDANIERLINLAERFVDDAAGLLVNDEGLIYGHAVIVFSSIVLMMFARGLNVCPACLALDVAQAVRARVDAERPVDDDDDDRTVVH